VPATEPAARYPPDVAAVGVSRVRSPHADAVRGERQITSESEVALSGIG